MENDAAVAKAVRDALVSLNDRLRAAADAGLSVELKVMSGHSIGPPAALLICMAEIERRVRL